MKADQQQWMAYQSRVLSMRQSSAIDFPAHVHLETMARCNAACNFCPYPTLDRKGAVMEDALILKIVSDLEDIPRLHSFQLSPFKVNEPFLDKRLFDLLDLFTARLPNASITLTSNASPITPAHLKKLSRYQNIGYLWISFNDHRKEEYERVMQLPYERTLARLQEIHAAKAAGSFSPPVVLSRVSDNSSVDQEFCQWVAINFPLFKTSIFRRGEWLGQISVNTQNEVPPVGCVRWFDLSITATGMVAHCCMDGKAAFPIGDVRCEHVLEIYNRPEYRRLRATIVSRKEVSPCSKCSFL